MREHHPTPEAPQAFQRARDLHTQLLAHLKNPINEAALKSEVEAAVDAAMEAEGLVPVEAKAHAKAEAGSPSPAAGAPGRERPAQADQAPGLAGSELPAKPSQAQPGHPSDAEPKLGMAGSGEAGTQRPSAKEAPLPGHVAAQVAQLEGVAGRTRAVAQRAQLEEMARGRALAFKGGAVALAVMGGLMIHFGMGLILAKMFTTLLVGQVVVDGLLSVLLGGLLAVFALHVAQQLGLSKLAARGPDRISSLQALRGIYRTELYGEASLTEAQCQELEQQLQAAHHTMLDNLDPEDHIAGAKLLTSLALGVLLILALAIPAAQHTSGGELWQHLLMAAFGSALMGGLVVVLAAKLQPLPPLGEGLMDPTEAAREAQRLLDEHRAREQKRLEAEGLAAEAEQKRLVAAAANRANEAEQAVKREAGAQAQAEARASQLRVESHRTERERRLKLALEQGLQERKAARLGEFDRLYQGLQDATEAYEQARGFTSKELRQLRQLKRRLNWLFGLLLVLSVLASIVATYPASLTLTELLNLPYQYLGGNRLALAPWLLFVALALFADFWLVQAYTQRSLAEVGVEVLEQGYQESRLRPQGIRYHVQLQSQWERVKVRTRYLIVIGALLLLVEFAANLTYLVHNSEANLALAAALALVPFAIFVAMTYPHVILHRKKSLVAEALAWGETLPQGPSLPLPSAHPYAEAESQQARLQAAERGLL